MNVAREQRRAGLTFEIIDPSTHRIDGQPKPFSGGSETATAGHFQKNPGRIPIGKVSEWDFLAFLQWNTPFHRQMHTSPFFLLILAECCSVHNHGASVVVGFIVYTYHRGGIWGLVASFRCGYIRLWRNANTRELTKAS